MDKKPNDITKTELFDILDADAIDSEEERVDALELVSKYGTYEIQPTADTQNAFPMIAQGFSEDWKMDHPRTDKKEKHK
ncbi:MAG: hypothetical protein IJW78_05905 [Clostridia bacterium]|nr:hypothetical protein [Clostridia bacterium]